MEPVNQTPFHYGPIAGRLNFPGHSLTLIVKGTFDLKPGQAATTSEEQLFLAGDEFYPDDDEMEGSTRYEADFAYFKPRADLLLIPLPWKLFGVHSTLLDPGVFGMESLYPLVSNAWNLLLTLVALGAATWFFRERLRSLSLIQRTGVVMLVLVAIELFTLLAVPNMEATRRVTWFWAAVMAGLFHIVLVSAGIRSAGRLSRTTQIMACPRAWSARKVRQGRFIALYFSTNSGAIL